MVPVSRTVETGFHGIGILLEIPEELAVNKLSREEIKQMPGKQKGDEAPLSDVD